MFMPSDWHEVNVGGAQLQTHDCAIKLRACFLPMKLSTVDLVNIWGPGYCLSAWWSLISYLNVDPFPYIHFLSTRHHSRDRYMYSQAFSVFHHSTTSMYYTERNWRTKSGGGLGMRLAKQKVIGIGSISILGGLNVIYTATWRSALHVWILIKSQR